MTGRAEGHGGPLGLCLCLCQPVAALHLPARHPATPLAELGGSATSHAIAAHRYSAISPRASPRGSREGERPSGHAGMLVELGDGNQRCGRDRGGRAKEMRIELGLRSCSIVSTLSYLYTIPGSHPTVEIHKAA